MDIDITCFFRNAEHADFSASAVERGWNAGPETWANAREEAARKPLLTTPEQLDAWRADIKDMGAWNEAERDAMDENALNALFIQWVSGDIREAEQCAPGDNGEIDWTEHQRLCEEGQTSGRISKGDDGRIYFYIGS